MEIVGSKGNGKGPGRSLGVKPPEGKQYGRFKCKFHHLKTVYHASVFLVTRFNVVTKYY